MMVFLFITPLILAFFKFSVANCNYRNNNLFCSKTKNLQEKQEVCNSLIYSKNSTVNLNFLVLHNDEFEQCFCSDFLKIYLIGSLKNNESAALLLNAVNIAEKIEIKYKHMSRYKRAFIMLNEILLLKYHEKENLNKLHFKNPKKYKKKFCIAENLSEYVYPCLFIGDSNNGNVKGLTFIRVKSEFDSKLCFQNGSTTIDNDEFLILDDDDDILQIENDNYKNIRMNKVNKANLTTTSVTKFNEKALQENILHNNENITIQEKTDTTKGINKEYGKTGQVRNITDYGNRDIMDEIYEKIGIVYSPLSGEALSENQTKSKND